jgi:hypothetical protein
MAFLNDLLFKDYGARLGQRKPVRIIDGSMSALVVTTAGNTGPHTDSSTNERCFHLEPEEGQQAQ